MAPILSSLFDLLVEVRRKEEVLQLRLSLVGSCDIIEEGGADDASIAPDTSYRGQIKTPAVRTRGLRQQGEALCIGDDLRGIERTLQRKYIGLGEVGLLASLTRVELRGLLTKVHARGEATLVDSGSDEPQGLAIL